MTNTTSRRVLITGTSTGFGNAAAQALAARGHTVFAAMRGVEGKNREKAQALKSWAAQGGHKLHVVEMDVTSDASVQAGVARALEQGGGLDAAISNAGVGAFGICETYTPAQFSQAFETNVVGAFRVAHAVLPLMREAKAGQLVFVSSTVGRIVLPFMGPYAATKFALESMAESLAFELKPLGIDVTVIQPGGYATGFMQNAMQPADGKRAEQYGPVRDGLTAYLKGFMDMIAAGKLGDPKEIAEAMVRLVEAPRDQRPPRLLVDAMFGQGVAAINQACAQVQDSTYAAFGFGKK